MSGVLNIPMHLWHNFSSIVPLAFNRKLYFVTRERAMTRTIDVLFDNSPHHRTYRRIHIVGRWMTCSTDSRAATTSERYTWLEPTKAHCDDSQNHDTSNPDGEDDGDGGEATGSHALLRIFNANIVKDSHSGQENALRDKPMHQT